jgi:hypothetical protein
MKKRPAIQFDLHDYDYLDTLDKDGWHWEFTRRNEKYRTAYDEMATLRKEGGIKCKNFDCLHCDIVGRPCPASIVCYVEDTLKIRPLFKTVSGLKMPDPSIKYFDLPDEAKPVTMIRPISPMKVFTGNDFQEEICQTWETRKMMFKNLFNRGGYSHGPKDAIFDFVNQILSPYPRGGENTLYIGISLDATRDELRNAFNNVLKKHVRPKIKHGDTKQTPDKWKSSLMIWDLRIFKNTYGDIAPIMGIAKDAAKKKFYRAYELIYGKKYNSDEYERPLIKKQYMKRYCNTCEQRPACKEPCPDVIGYVDQDSKNYQREMTGGNTIDTMAKLKKGRQKEDSTVSDMYEDPDMIGPE